MSKVRHLSKLQNDLDLKDWPVENPSFPMDKLGCSVEYAGCGAMWVELNKPSANGKVAFDRAIWSPRQGPGIKT